MVFLTIAIPTYNREKQLRRCLDGICKQLKIGDDRVEVLISDNASDYDVKSLFDEYWRQGYPVRLNRNKENIGMTANFLYCLSNTTSEYVWLFSDDEYINDNRIDLILDLICLNNPDYIFVNNSRIKKNNNNKSIEYINLPKNLFIKKISLFPALITKNIFKRDALLPLIAKKHVYNTLFPHLSIMYSIVRDSDRLGIIDGDIFTVTPGNSSGYKWFETFVLDLSNVLNENADIITKQERKYLDNQLLKYFYFKQFLSLGIDCTDKKRDTLEKFPKEDFINIYLMIKSRFSRRINFWIYIQPIRIMPKKIRNLFYNILMKYVQPIYRKKD